ncbi:MAG: hypothetical protein CVV63_00630 [Tenericutes bacterium HGW-Tenericutes-8]|nr:MAG: hypothetical protein CVV63_00630 [Tenericutes bacterium HGW-Tenericutes-8]
MKKTIVLLLMLLVFVSGCEQTEPVEQETVTESLCKNTPLAPNCYDPNFDLDFVETENQEYLINETFENEFNNQTPSNWLLYKNEEYSAQSAVAKVIALDDNKYVSMYSDGKNAPMYPQGVAKPASFILSTKFNLDTARKGVMTGKIMVPSVNGNEVSFGIYTGAVNTASIILDKQMKLYVKIGGPFFYHSGTADSGTLVDTGLTLSLDTFHRFTFEWDATTNEIIVIYHGETDQILYQGTFHVSSRYNATENGEIIVPNVIKVTMPKALNMAGYACLDDVIVTRKGA